MPNETWNRLVIEGPEEDVQRFVERVVSKDLDYDGEPYVLDFEAHVPVPPDFTRDDVRVWSVYAWGCLQPMSAEILERKPGRVVYFLTTAVSAPIPWLEATAQAEPTLSFVHEHMEEFGQGYGRMFYEGGKLVRNDDIEPTDLEWVIWDEDDE